MTFSMPSLKKQFRKIGPGRKIFKGFPATDRLSPASIRTTHAIAARKQPL